MSASGVSCLPMLIGEVKVCHSNLSDLLMVLCERNQPDASDNPFSCLIWSGIWTEDQPEPENRGLF